MGCIMAIGWYGDYFSSAISPWTTLGPLAIVVGISITQEGFSDLARHRGDDQSNKHPCTVISQDGRQSLCNPNKTTKPKAGSSKAVNNDYTKTVKIISAGTKEESQVDIHFHTVQRRDVRVGQLILIKNREMIPCDVVLLASSNENGGAYIETSGIDGETNLKLRNSAKPSIATLKPPTLDAALPSTLTSSTARRKYFQDSIAPKLQESPDENLESPEKIQILEISPSSPDRNKRSLSFDEKMAPFQKNHKPPMYGSSSPRGSSLRADPKFSQKQQIINKTNTSRGSSLLGTTVLRATVSQSETLEEATGRLAQWSVLGFPNGTSATCLANVPLPPPTMNTPNTAASPGLFRASFDHIRKISHDQFESARTLLGNALHPSISNTHSGSGTGVGELRNYVAAITCELPNASVHTFNGKLTLPPAIGDQQQAPIEVSLNADNFLLRGAFLRNTEWAIGVACYTGADTKLVKNSSAAPSRLSQLDQLVNRTIMIIIAVMMFFVLALSIGSVIVTNRNFRSLWYLGFSPSVGKRWPYLPNLEPPEWTLKADNLIQNMWLFTTLLNNFVPLSLYVTMELVTRALMIFINTDVVSDESYALVSCFKMVCFIPLSVPVLGGCFSNIEHISCRNRHTGKCTLDNCY
jgi:hypothetical protein